MSVTLYLGWVLELNDGIQKNLRRGIVGCKGRSNRKPVRPSLDKHFFVSRGVVHCGTAAPAQKRQSCTESRQNSVNFLDRLQQASLHKNNCLLSAAHAVVQHHLR